MTTALVPREHVSDLEASSQQRLVESQCIQTMPGTIHQTLGDDLPSVYMNRLCHAMKKM